MACDFAVVTRADVEGLELLEDAQEVCEALLGLGFPVRHVHGPVVDVARASLMLAAADALTRLAARRRAREGATEPQGGGRAAEGAQGAARGVGEPFEKFEEFRGGQR